jgi:hypothetical protein
MTDITMPVMVENRTTMGNTVLMYAHDVCNMFGAHGLKIGPNGELEVLILAPEESAWMPIEDAPMVQAGATRSRAAKKS